MRSYPSHFLFLHLVIDTGCFPILSVVSDFAVTIVMQMSPQNCDFNSFIRIPSGGIAGSYISVIILKENSCFSHNGCSNLHSYQQCESVFFSTLLPTLGIFCLLGNSHSNGCTVKSHCGFDLHFSDY